MLIAVLCIACTTSVIAQPEDYLEISNFSTVIHVPDDYPTVQSAVDNAPEYSMIYLADGEYLTSAIEIKDKQHLRITGNSQDVKIIHRTGFVNPPGHDVILILNSSDIELDLFSVEVKAESIYNPPNNVRIITVKDSNTISISNLVLNHGGEHAYSGNCAIKIDNSVYCTVADNYLSGTVGKFYPGMTGLYINSDNNSIYNNTVSMFMTCINIHGNNNTVHTNNLFTGGAGKHATDSGYNHWNSTYQLNYTYNNTIFTNYTGNFYNGISGEDLNNDGIMDIHHRISDTAVDHYPLIEPYGLSIDLIAAGIARPSMVYVNRNNTILVSIKRKGTYPSSECLNVSLTANDNVVDSRLITMNTDEYITRFVWLVDYHGTYDLKVEIHPENELREQNDTNNELTIKVTSSSPAFDHAGVIGSAMDYLNNSQNPTGSMSGFSNSGWAALAVTAAGEDPAGGRWTCYDRSLVDYLRNDPVNSVRGMPPGTNPTGLVSIKDFARMILVISAAGQDPSNFGEVNYLVMLKSYFDGSQFADPDLIEDDAFAVLALVSCGEIDNNMVKNAIDHIKLKQNENGGWSTFGEDSDVRVTSLAIQALMAAGENKDSPVISNALYYLKNMQQDDGGYSDAITTSAVIQAIIAAGENPSTYINNNKNPLDYLIDLQQDDGSFNYTADTSLFPTRTNAFVIPALCGIPYPAMIKTQIEPYELTDISISEISLKDDIYVNTTYPVTTIIKSNGGKFNVTLSSDGIPVESRIIRSVWYDSVTPVSFTWKPDNTGVHHLTVTVDADNRINEKYENNNEMTRQVIVLLPDLYPFSLDEPEQTYVNATNNITVSIDGKTDENFNITLTIDDEIIGQKLVKGIDNNTILSFEWRPSHIGYHMLELEVDPGNAVVEQNEENNIFRTQVNVVLPDLVPSAIISGPVYMNATNMMVVSLDGTAECFNISLIENATEVGKTSNITCYGNNNVSIGWKPNRPGMCTLQAVVDPDNDIQETDETNNVIIKEYEVVRPDIIPYNVSPEIIFLNETNTIIIYVNGTAEGFNATLFINGNHIDKKIDLDTYNGTIEFELTPPASGVHELTVLLDPDDDIIETNETNNNITANVFAANRIKLQLLSPLGGEIWSGIQNITWLASYEEPVMIDLYYSSNLGLSWNTIIQNITNTGSFQWDSRDLIDGKYIIKIIARKGNITQQDWSDLFFVYNKKSASNWGEFHSNAGFSLSDAPDTNEIAWASEEIGAEGSSSVIVADGKVFVYCAGWQQQYPDYTYLVALNESDGRLLWGTQIAPREYYSWATPTFYDGRIYVSSGKGVYCIDATREDKGLIMWNFKFPDGGGSVNGGPAIANGKVYVGSWNGGHYYCLDANNCSEIWKKKVGGASQSVPAVAYGRVFFGDFNEMDSKVYSVDIDDAYEFWNTSVDMNVCGSLTISDGAVYFTTFNFNGPGSLYTLDAGNGTQIWKNSIASTDSTPAFYAPSDSLRNYVYVSSGYGTEKIYCFNARNGETQWEVNGLGHWTNSPAVSADKKVFVGKQGGGGGMVSGYAGLYCLDALTGVEKWHSDLGGSSPAIANGMVYTIGGGRVIAFGSTTLPDLTVERIYVPDEINVGETVVITAQINNIGKSNVSESFSVVLTHKGNQIDKITVLSLDVGDVTNVSFNWTPKQTGNHHLMVTVDADETVTESDPMNNQDSVDVVVGDHQPDLAVTAIDAPYVNRVGMNINITVHIENIGSGTNSSFDVGLLINNRHEDNKTASLQNDDGTDNDNNNDIDNRTSVGFNWTPDTTGTYSLTGTVDLADDVDKTNNNMTIEIEVVTNETFFGYGPGYGGGTGGGSGGGIGSGDGTGESGEAGAGGMEYSGDTSSSVKEKMSDITGFLFGDASSGSSGGGGALPVALIICLIVILGLLYHGRRSEMRLLNDEKHHLQLPKGFRRKKS